MSNSVPCSHPAPNRERRLSKMNLKFEMLVLGLYCHAEEARRSRDSNVIVFSKQKKQVN